MTRYPIQMRSSEAEPTDSWGHESDESDGPSRAEPMLHGAALT